MTFKLFGMKCRLELVILILLVGLFLGSTLLCNCMTYESFSPMNTANTNQPRNNNLGGNWMGQQQVPSNIQQTLLTKLKNNNGLDVPLQNDQMLMFSQNKFSPDCCFGPGSNYSTSLGCNCISDKQAEYLNQRGGNRTFASEY